MTKGWWVASVFIALFVLWVLKCIYMRCYGATGRHHDYWMTREEDYIQPGVVWFQNGEWWVMPRAYGSTRRLFDKRSNPLDNDFVYESRTVNVPKVIRVAREKEY